MITTLLRPRLWLAALVMMAAPPLIAAPAPDFTLPSLAGENIKLSELRGDVVMINFWASWCGPCRQEMPHLERLYQRYRKLGFVLLGVNVEKESGKAQRMLREVKVSFPILFDRANRVSRLYAVKAMPTTVLIDRGGEVRFVHKGYLPGYEEKYEQQIRMLVRE